MNTIGLKPVTGGISAGSPVGGVQQTAKSDPTGFGDLLKRSIESVDGTMKESAAMSTGLVAGQHSNIHETMIAMEKSSISFKMLSKVQAKVLDAYKEVMRIQL
nr:flagellar hook-basal body complex protein FliE [Desulfobulbaceae bacterium]